MFKYLDEDTNICVNEDRKMPWWSQMKTEFNTDKIYKLTKKKNY